MIVTKISASSTYEVKTGPGLLENCGMEAAKLVKGRSAAIISDDIVAPLYADRVEARLKDAGFKVCRFIFPNGETSKNMQTLGAALEFLAENQLTRSDIILALGGGVVGDLAGLAAAIYLRGLKYLQLPTTLLAAIDSSVGGKTAVDLQAGKNLVGAFWQPAGVLCDTETLDTLPPQVLADGVAEALKYGVLFDKTLFALIADGDLKASREEIIARCVEWKRVVVERDERDTGERQLLNLGHTLGHAIERCSQYQITHGHAVATGMLLIAEAAWRAGLSKENCAPTIRAALLKRDLPVRCEYSAEDLYAGTLQDKKRSGDTLTLIIPQTLGHCVLHPMSVAEFLPFIRLGLEGLNA